MFQALRSPRVIATCLLCRTDVVAELFDQQVWSRWFLEPIENSYMARTSGQHNDARPCEVCRAIGGLQEFPAAHPRHLQI